MATNRFLRRFRPQVGHWSATIGLNQDGSAFAVYHMSGMAAELAEVQAIIGDKQSSNYLSLDIADPRIEIWDHFVRQDGQNMAQLPSVPNGFGARFDDAYRASQGAGSLFRNDLFVTIIMHPERSVRGGLAALIGRSGDYPVISDRLMQDLEAVLLKVDQGLARYGARRLGIREVDGVQFSELAETFHIIANARFRPLGLTLC